MNNTALETERSYRGTACILSFVSKESKHTTANERNNITEKFLKNLLVVPVGQKEICK